MPKSMPLMLVAAASMMLLGPLACQAKPAAKKTGHAKFHQAAPLSAPQIAAKSWLALIDSGKYAESWKAASPTFQAQVTQAQWAGAAQSAREPLGKLQKRTLKSGQHTDTLPGVPPGHYAVLTYTSSFEKKDTATETVVLTQDTDSKWQVSGYFIK